MKKNEAMKWVNGLRSNKYKQGKNKLCSIKKGQPSYCCLGVLASMKGVSSTLMNAENMKDLSDCPVTASNELLLDLYSAVGAPIDEYGENFPIKIKIDGKIKSFESLAGANDGGATFKQIANWIEKNYKLL